MGIEVSNSLGGFHMKPVSVRSDLVIRLYALFIRSIFLLMNSESQYFPHRHLSNLKDYRQKPRHVHKLSDSILETSFLPPRRTERDSYKSPTQFKTGRGGNQKLKSFRPSMFERGEMENRFNTSNYIFDYGEEIAVKSPRNYGSEGQRRFKFRGSFDGESYLSVSMVEGENSIGNRVGKPLGGEDMRMCLSPRREHGRNNDDILKKIKDYLSPRHKEEQSFHNQNSTANSKYSGGSTMESHKMKSNHYDSPHFLTKMRSPVSSTKQGGFIKKKELLSPANKDREEQKLIFENPSRRTTASKFIPQTNVSVIQHPKQQKKINLKDFIVLSIMGEGHSGVVYKAIHRVTGAVFALKKIPKITINKISEERQLLLQIKYQMFFDHPNIVKLYGCFDDKDNLYLILEFMEEGTLFQNLQKRLELMAEKEVSTRIREVMSAVTYLQDIDILHRDIKPENIVLSYGVGKLCDFGWVTKCEDRRNTFCGTYAYAAPQILDGKQYDRSVDIWCIGMLAYELLTGTIAFNRNDPNPKPISKMQYLSKEEDHCELFGNTLSLSKKSRNFVQIILRKDPKSRAQIEQLLHHPFLAEDKE